MSYLFWPKYHAYKELLVYNVCPIVRDCSGGVCYMKCRFYLHNIWLLCLAVLCTWPLHAVAAPSSDDEATGYEQIWESRLQEITIIESEVSESIERFTDRKSVV